MQPVADDLTEKLRIWLRGCPLIKKSNRFGVDYLSDKATGYALFAVPSQLKYHENILGEYLLDDTQVANFIFASKEPYGADIEQNLANVAFFNAVMAWIYEKNNAREFPEISTGTVTSIVPTLTGYPAQAGAGEAKYQIQIKVTYRI